MCKHDQGRENFGIWQSFEKARLNCSVPGGSNSSSHGPFYHNAEHSQFPYYFDEVQHVFYDKKKALIYALFGTPMNGVRGSAVCVYDVASLENAFNGPYKHQKSKYSIWEPDHQASQNMPKVITLTSHLYSRLFFIKSPKKFSFII